MPLFDYRCENGHTREVLLRGDEPAPTVCEECGAKATREMGAPASVKVRGGRRRKDIRFRKKGQSLNLLREDKS